MFLRVINRGELGLSDFRLAKNRFCCTFGHLVDLSITALIMIVAPDVLAQLLRFISEAW